MSGIADKVLILVMQCVCCGSKMSSNNHPERFPTDAEFAARNNRVASLIAKFKTEVRSIRCTLSSILDVVS